ncbi:SseB family protein [Blastopirellula retiformator]|uniref:SseB protein N-terminal domain-containing protein n=1 Tax=Blastopirellula retiformator TaxID=2527970 RepID=A0A5C5UYW2_9BACT|nr:SseB family protein [Blastopirellula retiformator]TWT30672.1 hypothetical protein Enr8_41930 [Blastopirellula retiformator]
MNETDVDHRNTKLAKQVLLLADSPNKENQRTFFQELQNGRVGIKIPQELGAVPSGDYVTMPSSDLRIPIATLPSGEAMLLVLANVAWLSSVEPDSVFVELKGREVLQIAKNEAMGIIVQVLGPERQGWSGVSATDVAKILG